VSGHLVIISTSDVIAPTYPIEISCMPKSPDIKGRNMADRFNPTGKWSAAAFSNEGVVASFHPTPWQFELSTLKMWADGHWEGKFHPISGRPCSFTCAITHTNGVTDEFEVHFLTSSRMIATKDDKFYRFGKKQ
jgi:hypothetical protein